MEVEYDGGEELGCVCGDGWVDGGGGNGLCFVYLVFFWVGFLYLMKIMLFMLRYFVSKLRFGLFLCVFVVMRVVLFYVYCFWGFCFCFV